eukprot:10476437-Lingulodinium_polyedra.AAC.1
MPSPSSSTSQKSTARCSSKARSGSRPGHLDPSLPMRSVVKCTAPPPARPSGSRQPAWPEAE